MTEPNIILFLQASDARRIGCADWRQKMLDPEHALNGDLPEKPESGGGSSSGDDDGSLVGTNEKSPSLAIEPSGSQKFPKHRATGPRTELGKQKASRNATKHAIFSKVVVLKGESRVEYERLFVGLRQARQPEDTVEELLVERLATIVWRLRRLLIAEGAEIRKKMDFFEWDQRNGAPKNSGKLELLLDSEGDDSLIQKINNPDVLKRCLQMLSALRAVLEQNGFDPEHDEPILEKIYGPRDPDLLRNDLYDCYETWQYTSEASEEEPEREGYVSPEQYQKNIIREIGKEIRRLKNYQKEWVTTESARKRLEIMSHIVPDAAELDRLLRYEAHLNRDFDRTLSQLVCLQRMRRGQPVPPPIEKLK